MNTLTLELAPKAKATFKARDIESGMHFAKLGNEKPKADSWGHVELGRTDKVEFKRV